MTHKLNDVIELDATEKAHLKVLTLARSVALSQIEGLQVSLNDAQHEFIEILAKKHDFDINAWQFEFNNEAGTVTFLAREPE